MPFLTKINNVYRASRKLRPGMRIFERYKSSRVPPRFANARRSVSWGDVLEREDQKDTSSDSRIQSRIRIEEPDSGLVLNVNLKYSFRKTPVETPQLQQDRGECQNRKNNECYLRGEDTWNGFVEDAAHFDQKKHVLLIGQPVTPSCPQNLETAISQGTEPGHYLKPESKNNLRKFNAKVRGKVDVSAAKLSNQQIGEVLQGVMRNVLASSFHTLLRKAHNKRGPEDFTATHGSNLDSKVGNTISRVKSIEIGTPDETSCPSISSCKETSFVPYGAIASVVPMKEKHESPEAESMLEKQADASVESPMQQWNDQIHSKYKNPADIVGLASSTPDEAYLKSEECCITVSMKEAEVNKKDTSNESVVPNQLDESMSIGLAKQFANDTLELASKHINATPSRQCAKKEKKVPREIPPFYHIVPKLKEHEDSKRNQFIAQSWSQRERDNPPQYQKEGDESSNSSHHEAAGALSPPTLSCAINEPPTNLNISDQMEEDLNSEIDSIKHIPSIVSINVTEATKRQPKPHRVKGNNREYSVFKAGNCIYVKNHRLNRRKFDSDSSIRYKGTRTFNRKAFAVLLYQGQGRNSNMNKPFTSDGRSKSGNEPPEESKGDDTPKKTVANEVITNIREVLTASMTKQTKIDKVDKPQSVVTSKDESAEILEAVKNELQKSKLNAVASPKPSGSEDTTCSRKITDSDIKGKTEDSTNQSYGKQLSGTSFTQMISPTLDYKEDCSKAAEASRKEILQRIKAESSKDKDESGKDGKGGKGGKGKKGKKGGKGGKGEDCEKKELTWEEEYCAKLIEPELDECGKARAAPPSGDAFRCGSPMPTPPSGKDGKGSPMDCPKHKAGLGNCLIIQNPNSSSHQATTEASKTPPIDCSKLNLQQSKDQSSSNVGKSPSTASILDICSNAAKQPDVPNCKLFDRGSSKPSLTNASSQDAEKNASQSTIPLECKPVVDCSKVLQQTSKSVDCSQTTKTSEKDNSVTSQQAKTMAYDCSKQNADTVKTQEGKLPLDCAKLLTDQKATSTDNAKGTEKQPGKEACKFLQRDPSKSSCATSKAVSQAAAKGAKDNSKETTMDKPISQFCKKPIDCSQISAQPSKSTEKSKVEAMAECKPPVDCAKVLQGQSSTNKTQSKSDSGSLAPAECKPPVDCDKVLQAQGKKPVDSFTSKTQSKSDSGNITTQGCKPPIDCAKVLQGQSKTSKDDCSTSKTQQKSEASKLFDRDSPNNSDAKSTCSKDKSASESSKYKPIDCSKYTQTSDAKSASDSCTTDKSKSASEASKYKPIDCSKYTQASDKAAGKDNQSIDCSKILERQSTKSVPSSGAGAKSTEKASGKPFDCSSESSSPSVDKTKAQAPKNMPMDCSKQGEPKPSIDGVKISNLQAGQSADSSGIKGKPFDCNPTKVSEAGPKSSSSDGGKDSSAQSKTKPIDCSKYEVANKKSNTQDTKGTIDCGKVTDLKTSKDKLSSTDKGSSEKTTGKPSSCSSSKISATGRETSLCGPSNAPSSGQQAKPIDCSKYNAKESKSANDLQGGKSTDCSSPTKTSSGKSTETSSQKTGSAPVDCSKYKAASAQDSKPAVDCSKVLKAPSDKQTGGSGQTSASKSETAKLFDRSSSCDTEKAQSQVATTTGKVAPGQSQECKPPTDCSKVGQTSKQVDCSKSDTKSSGQAATKTLDCSSYTDSAASQKSACWVTSKEAADASKPKPIDCSKYKKGASTQNKVSTQETKATDCSPKGPEKAAGKLFERSSSKTAVASSSSTCCSTNKTTSQAATSARVDCSQYKAVTDKSTSQESKQPMDCAELLRDRTNKSTDRDSNATKQADLCLDKSKPVDCSSASSISGTAKASQATKSMPVDCSKYKAVTNKSETQDCEKTSAATTKSVECSSKSSEKSASKLFDLSSSKTSVCSSSTNEKETPLSTKYKPIDCSKYNTNKASSQGQKAASDGSKACSQPTKSIDCSINGKKSSERPNDKPTDCSSSRTYLTATGSARCDTNMTTSLTIKNIPIDCSKHQMVKDKSTSQEGKPVIDCSKVATKSAGSCNVNSSGKRQFKPTTSKLFDCGSSKTSLTTSAHCTGTEMSAAATRAMTIECSKQMAPNDECKSQNKSSADSSKTSGVNLLDCNPSKTSLTSKGTRVASKKSCNWKTSLRTLEPKKPTTPTDKAGGRLVDCKSLKAGAPPSSSCSVEKEVIYANKNDLMDCPKNRMGAKKANPESQKAMVCSKLSETKTNKSNDCSSSTTKREKLFERGSSKADDCFNAENVASRSTEKAIDCSSKGQKPGQKGTDPCSPADQVAQSNNRDCWPVPDDTSHMTQDAECRKSMQNICDAKAKSKESIEMRPVAPCTPCKPTEAAEAVSMQPAKMCSPAANAMENFKSPQPDCVSGKDSPLEREKTKTEGILAKRIDFSKYKYSVDPETCEKEVPKSKSCTPVLCIKNLEAKRQEVVKRVKLKKHEATHYNCCLKITGQRKVEVGNCPMPPMGDECVVVRMHSVGISGSDVYMFEKGIQKIDSYDISLGHEGAGEIVEIGQRVTSLRKGDRVCIEAGVPCGCCKYCRLGRYNICPYMQFSGLLATYCTHPARLCHKIPKSMSYDDAALAHPLSLGLQACEKGHVSVGSKVLILGACPLGLSSVIAARAMGADKIAVIDVLKKNLQVATDLCADVSILANQSMSCRELVDKVLSEMKCRPNVIIDCCGCSKTVKMAVDLSEQGGDFVLAGCQSECADFPILMALAKEICFHTSFRSSNMFKKALTMIETGRAQVGKMITHRAEFCQTQKGFEVALNEAEKGTIKVMVNWSHDRNSS